MPKSIGEFINELAIKAGMKADDEHLKNVLSAPDLQKITIPDEVVTGIDNGLLSIDAAKNNHPEIKKHYFASAYNGLDKEIDGLMEEQELPEDVRNEIRAERSSTKRAALVARKIKELEAKKADAKPSTQTALQKQIDDLHAQLKAANENAEKARGEYEGKIQNFKTQTQIDSLLGTYKTIYDDLDPSIKSLSMNSILTKALQDNDAEFASDDKGLAIRKKDGTNLFGDNHIQLTPRAFIDKTLSQNKVLKVSDPGKAQGQQGNTNGNGTQNGQTVQGTKTVNTTLAALANESLRDLEPQTTM